MCSGHKRQLMWTWLQNRWFNGNQKHPLWLSVAVAVAHLIKSEPKWYRSVRLRYASVYTHWDEDINYSVGEQATVTRIAHLWLYTWANSILDGSQFGHSNVWFSTHTKKFAIEKFATEFCAFSPCLLVIIIHLNRNQFSPALGMCVCVCAQKKWSGFFSGSLFCRADSLERIFLARVSHIEIMGNLLKRHSL